MSDKLPNENIQNTEALPYQAQASVYPPPSYQHQVYHPQQQNAQQQNGQFYPPPNMPPPNTAYYIPQPPMIIWGKLPQRAYCPYCRQEGVTEVTQRVGSGGILIAALLFIFTCCCCWVWCCDDCKDADHHCPHCKQIIGQRKVLNQV